MKQSKSKQPSTPCILIEGPRWADTQFYANWLAAITKTNILWTVALRDRTFADRISRLNACCRLDFGIFGTEVLFRLEKHECSVVIDANGHQVDEFAILVDLGFFVRTGLRYQMTMPSQLSIADMKSAALKLAGMEEKSYLDASSFLATLPKSTSEGLQVRFRKMDEDLRCAKGSCYL